MFSAPATSYWLALTGALCLYIYVQSVQYDALESKYQLQSLAIKQLEKDALTAAKAARTRVKTQTKITEEKREHYFARGSTAKDMQQWWDEGR